MCRSKGFSIFILVTMLVTGLGFSQNVKADYQNFSASYLSWGEKMTVDNGISLTPKFANFSGMILQLENKSFVDFPNMILHAGFIFGQAAGGSTSTPTYQSSSRGFYGGRLGAKYEKFLTPEISFLAGPALLYRSFKWNTDSTPGLTATSGADINLAVMGEIKIFLNKRWDIRQEFGALLFNATTYWSIGVGYNY